MKMLQQQIDAHVAATLRALEEERDPVPVFRGAWLEEDEEITIVTIKPVARPAG